MDTVYWVLLVVVIAWLISLTILTIMSYLRRPHVSLRPSRVVHADTVPNIKAGTVLADGSTVRTGDALHVVASDGTITNYQVGAVGLEELEPEALTLLTDPTIASVHNFDDLTVLRAVGTLAEVGYPFSYSGWDNGVWFAGRLAQFVTPPSELRGFIHINLNVWLPVGADGKAAEDALVTFTSDEASITSSPEGCKWARSDDGTWVFTDEARPDEPIIIRPEAVSLTTLIFNCVQTGKSDYVSTIVAFLPTPIPPLNVSETQGWTLVDTDGVVSVQMNEQILSPTIRAYYGDIGPLDWTNQTVAGFAQFTCGITFI